MRVVIVTTSSYPDLRILEEGEILYQMGFEVIMLSQGKENEPTHERNRNIKIEHLIPGPIHVFEMIYYRVAGKINRTLLKISWRLLRITKIILFSTRIVTNFYEWINGLTNYEKKLLDRLIFFDPDVIHFIDIRDLKSGIKAKQQLNTPLILDLRKEGTKEEEKILEKFKSGGKLDWILTPSDSSSSLINIYTSLISQKNLLIL